MTRAMDQLSLTRADYRRRYGTDMPEVSMPSRFLEEVPGRLIEDLGSPRSSRRSAQAQQDDFGDSHYSYEDEDQSARPGIGGKPASAPKAKTGGYSGPEHNAVIHNAHPFAPPGKNFNIPNPAQAEPTGK